MAESGFLGRFSSAAQSVRDDDDDGILYEPEHLGLPRIHSAITPSASAVQKSRRGHGTALTRVGKALISETARASKRAGALSIDAAFTPDVIDDFEGSLGEYLDKMVAYLDVCVSAREELRFTVTNAGANVWGTNSNSTLGLTGTSELRDVFTGSEKSLYSVLNEWIIAARDITTWLTDNVDAGEVARAAKTRFSITQDEDTEALLSSIDPDRSGLWMYIVATKSLMEAALGLPDLHFGQPGKIVPREPVAHILEVVDQTVDDGAAFTLMERARGAAVARLSASLKESQFVPNAQDDVSAAEYELTWGWKAHDAAFVDYVAAISKGGRVSNGKDKYDSAKDNLIKAFIARLSLHAASASAEE